MVPRNNGLLGGPQAKDGQNDAWATVARLIATGANNGLVAKIHKPKVLSGAMHVIGVTVVIGTNIGAIYAGGGMLNVGAAVPIVTSFAMVAIIGLVVMHLKPE